jgi:chaperonin GroEL (HSP60 family)
MVSYGRSKLREVAIALLSKSVRCIVCTRDIQVDFERELLKAGIVVISKADSSLITMLKRSLTPAVCSSFSQLMSGEKYVSLQSVSLEKDRVLLRLPSSKPVCTVILCGPTTAFCEEATRALDDGVRIIETFSKDSRVVPGGGLFELLCSGMIARDAVASSGIRQVCLQKISHALTFLPKLLKNSGSVAAALSTDQLVAAVVSEFEAHKKLVSMQFPDNVLEPLLLKATAIRLAMNFAVEVCNTVIVL